MQLTVKTLDNGDAGTIDLDDSIFGLSSDDDTGRAKQAALLHRMVNWQLAKRRAGTHKVKGMGGARPRNRSARREPAGRVRDRAEPPRRAAVVSCTARSCAAMPSICRRRSASWP